MTIDPETGIAPEFGGHSAVDACLVELKKGDTSALERLLEHVYPELRQLAGAIFSDQRRGHTLQPTALVHEAWLKLAGNLRSIEDRRHFFVVAGMAMRQIVADHARGKLAQKRGGGNSRVTLDVSLARREGEAVDMVALDDCLERLTTLNERHGRVAELRLFSGLSIDETAEELGVSPRSVDSDWAMAKAWLRSQLA
ncbi:RNA polymerase sigma factor SigD [Planctomycetes bacterium Pla163]|uniref:RNA polymerase sigma factor SigD n=1 Tax=Rohdeia mirabilis TaxID=2528008 RepID=A0A518CW15_9BACT|nr:RNA polymerase sigma factor SigD [Planctomycetes bacterium Pla163]